MFLSEENSFGHFPSILDDLGAIAFVVQTTHWHLLLAEDLLVQVSMGSFSRQLCSPLWDERLLKH